MKGRPRMSGRSITSTLEAIVERHLTMQEIYLAQILALAPFHLHARPLIIKA